MRGSSRRRIEVRIVALPTLEVMTSPGVATAALKPSTTTADSTVTYDSGTSRTTDESGPPDYGRGVSWS
jgi:hypothetical protein